MKKWFFAILPPEEISREIIAFQQELKNQYGFSHALKTPPHITIIPPFTATKEQVDLFIANIQSFKFPPIEIVLDGFEAFHPRVIFVDVALNKALNSFAKQIKFLFSQEKIKPNSGDKHYFTPHITLANRELNNKTFKAIFSEFKLRKYKASFEVNTLQLLVHENGMWKTSKSIFF